MKSLAFAAIAAVALSAPIASFAQQSNQPVTRAQVREQLIQLEQAGYNPAQRDPYYPNDIQAAQARVDAQQGNAAVAAGDTTGYGGAMSSAQSGGPALPSVSGHTMNADGTQPTYFGR
jgi:hypothetical protein